MRVFVFKNARRNQLPDGTEPLVGLFVEGIVFPVVGVIVALFGVTAGVELMPSGLALPSCDAPALPCGVMLLRVLGVRPP